MFLNNLNCGVFEASDSQVFFFSETNHTTITFDKTWRFQTVGDTSNKLTNTFAHVDF